MSSVHLISLQLMSELHQRDKSIIRERLTCNLEAAVCSDCEQMLLLDILGCNSDTNVIFNLVLTESERGGLEQ